MPSHDEVRDLLFRAFGEWTIRRSEPAWATRAVADADARGFLTDVGLPVQALNLFSLDPAFGEAPVTLADRLSDLPPSAGVSTTILDAYGQLIYLGSLPDLGAFLDPATGRVLSFVSWSDPPFVVNGGIAEFAYFLAYVETHRRANGVLLDDLETEEGYEAAAVVAAHLMGVDPAAFADADENIWPVWMDDGFAIGLFQDWAWDHYAVEYFLSRGIDPTVREPSRPLPRRMNGWPAADGGAEA
ncbi:SUKH-4 family immunity protein [Actinospica robiniae]|uniref:SUKH-4 family immunity protein n=1 Tax=Actinospica robiniae TaxID=304901 RepID=UPI00041FCD6A|nr:SUKH-4 family immunity protein [Actinospica robiniae]